MKRGFTLLELIVVIIIIGILATLGFTQYTKMVEKGRTAEARMILGQIRTAQIAYKLEKGDYTQTMTDLAVNVPTGDNTTCSATTHYFNYDVTGYTNIACARRCISGGKDPQAPTSYYICLNYDTGKFTQTAGY